MALFPGPPGWASARRELLDFMVQGKINRRRHTDHPAQRNSIRTNQHPPTPSPHFLQAGYNSCHPTNSVKALKVSSFTAIVFCYYAGSHRWCIIKLPTNETSNITPPTHSGPKQSRSKFGGLLGWLIIQKKYYHHHHYHNHFTALFSGPPGSAGARRELRDSMVQGKINRGRNTDHLAGCHSIRINHCPPPPSPPFPPKSISIELRPVRQAASVHYWYRSQAAGLVFNVCQDKRQSVWIKSALIMPDK